MRYPVTVTTGNAIILTKKVGLPGRGIISEAFSITDAIRVPIRIRTQNVSDEDNAPLFLELHEQVQISRGG
jgi:hypothetical protein